MRRQWKPIRCLQLYTYSCIHIKKIISMASSPKKYTHIIHTSINYAEGLLKETFEANGDVRNSIRLNGGSYYGLIYYPIWMDA